MNKNTITINEFAAWSNLSTRRLRQLSAEGKLPRITRSRLQMPDAVKMLFAHYQKVSEEMTAERLASLRATRLLKEHELSVVRGGWILRTTAESTVRAVVRTLHGFIRNALELTGPLDRKAKLAELGVDEARQQSFQSWDITSSERLIDQIAERCARAAENDISDDTEASNEKS